MPTVAEVAARERNAHLLRTLSSRRVYTSTPAQALIGRGRCRGPSLKNVEREGILCLTLVAFQQRAQRALCSSLHVLIA